MNRMYTTASLVVAAGLSTAMIGAPAHAVDLTSTIINAGFEDAILLDGQDTFRSDAWKVWADDFRASIRHWNPSDTDRISTANNQFFDISWGGIAPQGNNVLAVRTQAWDYTGGTGLTQQDTFGNRTFPAATSGTAGTTTYNWAADSGNVRSFEAAVQHLTEAFDPTARYILSVQVGRLQEGDAGTYDNSGFNAGAYTGGAGGTSSRFANDAPVLYNGYNVELMAGGFAGNGTWVYGTDDNPADADYIGTIAGDNTGLNLEQNTWGTSTVAYTPGISADASALAGKNLVIRLSALEPDNRQNTAAVAFDDVQLTKIYAGDANEDDKIDLNDGGILVGNFGTAGNNWNTGDFTGDGLVDLNDAGLLVGNFGDDYTAAASSFAVAEATAGNSNAQWVFDEIVNGLTTQISVASISQAFLSTEALDDGAILELIQQAVPFSSAQAGPGAQVGEFMTSNFITGTELIDVTVDSLGTYSFEARWNVVGGIEQSQIFEITFVPEPSSLALLGLGGLLLARRRRNS